ncbi:MAG TPA: HNH endonuclease [Burkholderiaceae bacterium]
MQKVEVPRASEQQAETRKPLPEGALESPAGAQIGQLQALAQGSNQAMRLVQLRAWADASPQVAHLQRMSASFGNGAPAAQLKTDVKEDKDDATAGKETSSKKIATPTQGTKWFRFARGDGDVIESFANNLYKGADAGSNPVHATIDLSNNTKGVAKSAIPELSRAQHFALGDAMIGKSKDYRKGTYTWHHMTDAYKMELVDMYTHGGFYHYGGFSAWQEGVDDDDD